jgi:hypothetical protein
MLNYTGLTIQTDIQKPQQQGRGQQKTVPVKKTSMMELTSFSMNPKKFPIHDMDHTLNKCRTFRWKSMRERKQFLRKRNLCYKCCESDTHTFKTSDVNVKCAECGSVQHPTALNKLPDNWATSEKHGGERREKDGEIGILSKCTAVCGNLFTARSCAKAVLVNVCPKVEPMLDFICSHR